MNLKIRMNLRILGLGIILLGLGICVMGTALAILFVPCKFFGQFMGWHFIFECSEVLGNRICSYHFIDITALLLELIFINGVGLVLIVLGFFLRRKQKRVKPKKKPILKKEMEIEELE